MTINKMAIFHLVLGFLPGKLGDAASRVEVSVTEKGLPKREKAIDIASSGLALGKVLSETMIKDPRFKNALEKANDALVLAANVAQQIHDEANTVTTAQGDGSGD